LAIIIILVIFVPYLNLIIYPIDYDSIGNQWSERICTQTNEKTAGACVVATFLRDSGKEGNEKSISIQTQTTKRGTNSWQMAQTLRQEGYKISFKFDKELIDNPPAPCIAGVKFDDPTRPYHYIALLGNTERGYIVGDPLEGRLRIKAKYLGENYDLTGLFMIIDK
jgi:ABC-type bacteriocin/lantibiotic exporter with double-glycine peptidase domain